ncbi:MAG: hypothetical protein LRS43_03110 [Desulfurococcales archaeon]|nr:hypothetical protein [Desulfurococcales archaeon]
MLRRIKSFTSILAILPLAAILVTIITYSASTSNLIILVVLNDKFYNYDFVCKDPGCDSPNKVDWPINILFWNNAEVNKIKSNYWGLEPCWLTAIPRHLKMDDGFGWFWDSDCGTKLFDEPLRIRLCSISADEVHYHMRLYADPEKDYNYNSGWGKYVLAAAHIDDGEGLEDWAGFSELAEDYVAYWGRALGWAVAEDWANFYNNESCRRDDGGSHIWYNNGYATAVKVP